MVSQIKHRGVPVLRFYFASPPDDPCDAIASKSRIHPVPQRDENALVLIEYENPAHYNYIVKK